MEMPAWLQKGHGSRRFLLEKTVSRCRYNFSGLTGANQRYHETDCGYENKAEGAGCQDVVLEKFKSEQMPRQKERTATGGDGAPRAVGQRRAGREQRLDGPDRLTPSEPGT